jgi:hypothetical protein
LDLALAFWVLIGKDGMNHGWMDGWQVQYRRISFVKFCEGNAGKHDTIHLYPLTLYMNNWSYRRLFLRPMERKTNPCIHASRERDFSFLEKMRGRASNVYQAAHSIVLTLTHKDLFLLISGYTESRKRSIVLARSVRRPLSLIQRRRSLGKMDSSIVIKVKICKLNTVLIGSQDNTS